LAVVVTRLQPTVEVFFDLSATGDGFLSLDSPTSGKLDDAAAILAGDVAVDISEYCTYVTVTRGRSRELDQIQVGTLYVGLENQRSEFVPSELVENIPLTDDDGEPLTDDDDNPLVNDFVSPFGPGSTAPGRRVRVSVEGQPIFDGIVEDWDFFYRNDGRHTATLRAVDALGSLGRAEFTSWTTTAGQTAGPRIVDVLNRPEVGYPSNRNIGTGVSTLQADPVSYGASALNYLQLVAQSDLGRLFADRFGVLTFRDRHSTIDSTVMAFFDDVDGAGIPFQGIDIQFGSELLFNRVAVDRETGILQSATDTDSQARYGARSLTITGLLLDSDAQSEEMAEFLLNIYREPQIRIAGLTVNLDVAGVDASLPVLSLDIGAVVAVTWTPPGTDARITQQSVVEGISHRLATNEPHIVELSLSPLSQTGVLILDSAGAGVLDSAVLAF
jgi:hypothetical protein